jgi:hypothetical protein
MPSGLHSKADIAPYGRHVSKVSISGVNDSFDHLGPSYLKGRAGDAANAILCAAGYNFRRILSMAEGSFVPNPGR